MSEYLLCDGSALSISDYPKLYAVIGKKFGGTDTTFNLPDLTGRCLVGSTTSGSTGGSETVTLGLSQMPSHNHIFTTNSIQTGSDTSTRIGTIINNYTTNQQINGTSSANGSGTPHNNMMPSCVLQPYMRVK